MPCVRCSTFPAVGLIGLLCATVARADDPAPPVRLGSTHLRHAAVWLAWGPDSKVFASAGTDGAVRV